MANSKRLLPTILGALLLAGCGSWPGQAAQPAAPAPSSAAAASTLPVGAAGSDRPALAANEAAPASAPPSSVAAPPASAPPPSATPAPTVGVPVELQIPAIKVDAPVEHVGEDSTGAMLAPAQWNDVAWFDLGYRPGQPGSAVIAGHLDSTTDRAVFWDLHLLQPGNQVILKDDDGSQLTFQVVGSTAYPYDQAPLQQIFGPASTPLLNLITCNGTWDAANKNYNQRLVVYTKEVAKS